MHTVTSFSGSVEENVFRDLIVAVDCFVRGSTVFGTLSNRRILDSFVCNRRRVITMNNYGINIVFDILGIKGNNKIQRAMEEIIATKECYVNRSMKQQIINRITKSIIDSLI